MSHILYKLLGLVPTLVQELLVPNCLNYSYLTNKLFAKIARYLRNKVLFQVKNLLFLFVFLICPIHYIS